MTQFNIWEHKLLGTALFTPKALIKHIGRTPAALLQQLHYLLQNSTFSQYGERWVSRTLESWAEILECSPKTIQRAFDRLERFGLVLSSRFHTHAYCQRKSYRVDYAVLQKLLANEPKRLDQPRHNVLIDVDTLSGSNNKISNTDFKKQHTDEVLETRNPVEVSSVGEPESIPTNHPVLKIDKGKIVEDPVSDWNRQSGHSLDKSFHLSEAVETEKDRQVDSVEEKAVEAVSKPVEVKKLDTEVEQEIVETVGHKLSSSLRNLVIQASIEVIQDALTILRTTKNVKNKAGLLRRAIENQWKPSAAAKTEKKFKLDPDFDEWWGYAKQLGLVMGSELKGDQFWIYAAPGGEPIPYAEIRSMFSMNWLKRRIQS